DLSPRPPTSKTSPITALPAAGGAACSALRAHPAASRTTATSAAWTIRRDVMCASRGWCGLRRFDARAQLVTATAACLVQIGAANQHAAAALLLAIGPVGGRAAHHADRQRLGDV